MTASTMMIVSEEQIEASSGLARLVLHCIQNNDAPLIERVRKYWNDEAWESIKTKFSANAITFTNPHYLWWWEGVKTMLQFDEEQR